MKLAMQALTAALLAAYSCGVGAATIADAAGHDRAVAAGAEHGMPVGRLGGDGRAYRGVPDVRTANSLADAGDAPGGFSTTAALAAQIGRPAADAEFATLSQRYGSNAVAAYVAVQNFAIDDALRMRRGPGTPTGEPVLRGKALAARLCALGAEDRVFYVGVMLDRLVGHAVHERVMNDIDADFGPEADANFHRIADRTQYDVARIVGATGIALAPYH